MNIWPLLFKDPVFLGALIIFCFSLAIFMWFTLALILAFPRQKSLLPNPKTLVPQAEKPLFSLGKTSSEVPKKEGASSPALSTTASEESAASSGIATADSKSINTVLESRLLELTKRLTSLEVSEHKRKKQGPDRPLYLDPLIKRIQLLEKEINKIKILIAQVSSNNRPQELASILEKVNSMQKVLEHLSGESEVSKPS